MVKCDCPNPAHTDPTGCILNHDGELGTVCQICYKLHQKDIVGLPGVIQCRHRRIKIEDNHADGIDKFYCRVCKSYLPNDIAQVALLTQDQTIKIWTGNRWGPDTCDCKVDVAFDHDTLADEVYTYTTKTCPHHANLKGQQFLDVMHDENFRKNETLKLIIANVPNVRKTVTVGKDSVDVLDDGVDYVFNFTGDDDARVLHVELQGSKLLSVGDKTSMKDLADSQFGLGKVVFE